MVVFGSACVDLLMQPERLPRPGVTVLAPTYQLLPGGKGANQAHACAMASAEKDTSADTHENEKKNKRPDGVCRRGGRRRVRRTITPRVSRRERRGGWFGNPLESFPPRARR